MAKYISWDEAERLFPECSAAWDLFIKQQNYTNEDDEYVIKLHFLDGLFRVGDLIEIEYRKCVVFVAECRCARYSLTEKQWVRTAYLKR